MFKFKSGPKWWTDDIAIHECMFKNVLYDYKMPHRDLRKKLDPVCRLTFNEMNFMCLFQNPHLRHL